MRPGDSGPATWSTGCGLGSSSLDDECKHSFANGLFVGLAIGALVFFLFIGWLVS